jgi:aspartyl-tRNA(Asn)/glutamyl-tRNA(Gln) amidotransferase subunit B
VPIGIVRAHLEEDAAKNVHMGGAEGRIAGADRTLVDFNRAGNAARRDRHRSGPPLVRAREALPAAAAPDGRRARNLGRGDGEGLARFDVNVSVRP